MGKILRFSGPDAGRAQVIYDSMSTTGEHTDLHTLGETVVAAVAEQIRQ